MDENKQIPIPKRIELGIKNRTDEHVICLLDFYKEKQIDIINIDEDSNNPEYDSAIQIEFYSDSDELIDKIEIPYAT